MRFAKAAGDAHNRIDNRYKLGPLASECLGSLGIVPDLGYF